MIAILSPFIFKLYYGKSSIQKLVNPWILTVFSLGIMSLQVLNIKPTTTK